MHHAQWLVAAGVRELPVRAARDEEEAARAELEAVLGHAVRPDGGDAVPREGVDDLVECELEWGSARTGWKLGDARLRDTLHAGYLDEGAVALALVPRGDFDGAEVFDKVAAMDGEPLRFHPPVVSEPAVAASARDGVLRCAVLGHCAFLRYLSFAVRMVPDSEGVVG